MNFIRLTNCFLLLTMISLAGCSASMNGDEVQTGIQTHAALDTPRALQIEHKALHRKLAAAIEAGGETGAAAKELRRQLRPHFEEEERYAMPPLGLLEPLATDAPNESMRPAIAMAERLEANYEKMLEEHRHIADAARQLRDAARTERKSQHAEFAETLIVHAQKEEQVLYPATILIGKYLTLKLNTQAEGSSQDGK